MKAFQIQSSLIKTNSSLFLLNRKFARYISFFILITIPTSSFSLLGYSSEHLFRAIFLVQLINFGAIGMLHAMLMERHALFSQYTVKERFYFSFVLTLVICGALLLFFFILNATMEKMVLVSCCAFLLPYMLYQAWVHFLQLPKNKQMTWQGYTVTTGNTNIVYLSAVMVNLRLSKRYLGYKEKSFLLNTPVHIPLGQIFNSFLNVEKDSPTSEIELTDHNNVPYGWRFFELRFGGLYSRLLDPSKSLHENRNIRKNTTILVKRVTID